MLFLGIQIHFILTSLFYFTGLGMGILTLQVSILYIASKAQVHRSKHYFIIHQTMLVPPQNISTVYKKQNMISVYFHVQISSNLEI